MWYDTFNSGFWLSLTSLLTLFIIGILKILYYPINNGVNSTDGFNVLPSRRNSIV